ncbi:unnamed protein product [Caenorhabditis bovis]|uniref:UDP-N-acetylglucosamine diphosphorylase n=1 Tax=Caenorhabditis bovis TaxID=2654633 RepID=A0A8S1EQX9_9PELO|nr:unnamed protein product [Caenorhabditis bovis]
MPAPSFDEVSALVGEQKHLVQFYNELSEEEKLNFYNQLKSINFADARRWFDESAHLKASSPENLSPIPSDHYFCAENVDADEMRKYWGCGLDAIARGEVCAIVLAGGQASRLGSSQPKGTIPLGINTAYGDSLLGIQAAKIALLQAMAGELEREGNGKIHWAIMTSPGTDEATREHVMQLAKHHGFNFDDQITIFSQAEIPAYDENGEFLLASKGSLVASPNGNGGMYSALAPHLPRLRAMGIKYFHVYCVDNILCKVADPHFIGFAKHHNADVATKCVPKEKGELVGSVCLDSGRPRVVEYSELGPELADQKTPEGKYLFGAGSIANHFFTMEFLEKLCSPSFQLPYHRAHKKIPHISRNGELVKPEKPNGIKLEQFIFDVFEHSNNFFVWEVARASEFSPLKNAESVGKDCLSTCRRDLAALNKKWLENAGAQLRLDKPFFLKTLVSYNGENLQDFRGLVISTEVLEKKANECQLFLHSIASTPIIAN